MLHHFTWYQFLMAATILTVAWYGGVILFFRKGGTGRFMEKPEQRAEPLQHT